MASLIEYHIPEAISIRVTKVSSQPALVTQKPLIEIGEDALNSSGSANNNDNNNNNSHNNNNSFCTFCVDPQLTSFAVLQTLVVRAFNLQCDFVLYYVDRSTNKRNMISKDIDLHQAFITSSHPFLEISLNVIDYGNALSNLANEWQLSKNINKYRNILSEWDVVTNSDIILAQTINKTNNFILKQLEKIKEKAISTTNNSWYLAETIYQYIIADDKREDPIDDVAFRSFQDSEGRILSQRNLRIAVYRRGVEQSLRRVIWKHLLNVYPENFTGQERINFIKLRCETYRQMRELWQKNATMDPEVKRLCHMVRKDVHRTDRHHPFFANSSGVVGKSELNYSNDECDSNPNVTALYNILITYALNHKHRYCQGMSDLASPLLFVMKDEAHAYITFCALMHRLGENFSLDGLAISRKFTHLTALLQHYDSELFRYLHDAGAHELLFCYRWLLLDLKREFPFEETLEMLEVLWASIPPSISAYKNLYDDGHLYKPETDAPQLAATVSDSTQPSNEISISSNNSISTNNGSTISVGGVAKNGSKKPKNEQLRCIKFLPNVLSSDSQVLDSPTTSDSDECDFGRGCSISSSNDSKCVNDRASVSTNLSKPVAWYSPDLSKLRKKFDFEPRIDTASKDANPFDSISNECFEATILLNEESLTIGENVFSCCINQNHPQDDNEAQVVVTEEKEVEEEKETGKPETESTNKCQNDDTSSCSTVDSGFHRSNTLSSEMQVLYDLMPGTNQQTGNHNIGGEEIAKKRRQRFHCMSGLHNVHCNGDDELSEDEGVTGYDAQSIDEPGFFQDSQDSKVLAHNSTTTDISAATNCAIDESSEQQYNKRCSKPASFKEMMMTKTLLSVGKSYSTDSVTGNNDLCCNAGTDFDKQNHITLKHTPLSSQLTVDDRATPEISVDESPVNEFEVNSTIQQFSMAKSVSEEMLNNIDNMQTLNVNPHNTNADNDALDNISSSSTSSLVILSKRQQQTNQASPNNVDNGESERNDCKNEFANQPLLSPEKIDPNDAFMLFLCLTIMLQNRDRIIESNMDRNDIQMYFDAMIRKHNVRNVLSDARHLFHTYLSQWHKECLHK